MGRLTKEQRMDKLWSKMTKAERSRALTFELKWPEFAACMARAARSSGVPFATLARAAKAARKALAECGQSTWIGAVSGDCNDARNWLYSRLPTPGDAIVFPPCLSDLTNAVASTLNTITVNLQGRTL